MTFLNLMISRRPDSLKHSGPLYLRPPDSPRENTWYSSELGRVCTIDKCMRKISILAGLYCTNKKFTNPSIQKTTVRKLQKTGISNDKIAAITGHHSEQSLKDYADVDLEDHKSISAVLCSTHPLKKMTNFQSQMTSFPVEYLHPPSLLDLQKLITILHNSLYTFWSNTTCSQINQDILQPSRKRSK